MAFENANGGGVGLSSASDNGVLADVLDSLDDLGGRRGSSDTDELVNELAVDELDALDVSKSLLDGITAGLTLQGYGKCSLGLVAKFLAAHGAAQKILFPGSVLSLLTVNDIRAV